jgi:imidazolonepropionase
VIPGFVDSHAHLVFAGTGPPNSRPGWAVVPDGGGIATTVAATRAATDAQLSANVARLSCRPRRAGVTTFETKSGYGLRTPDEARSLRIAGEFTSGDNIFGAHVVPAKSGEPRRVRTFGVGEMLDECRPHARWIDGSGERGAFDVDEARTILEAGAAAG